MAGMRDRLWAQEDWLEARADVPTARRRRPLVGGSSIIPPAQDVPHGSGGWVVRQEAWEPAGVATLSLNRLFFSLGLALRGVICWSG